MLRTSTIKRARRRHEQEALVAEIKAMGEDTLNNLVDDVKDQEALTINREGVASQVEFLLSEGWDIAAIRKHIGAT